MERVEVGIRELRLNLSKYVARVRSGTEVIVTDHGNPVARLGPIDAQEAHIERLIREGKRRTREAAQAPDASTADPSGRRRAARQRDGARGPTLIAYFDSSAFVKLVLDEPGTDDARALRTDDIGSVVETPRPRDACSRGSRPAGSRVQRQWCNESVRPPAHAPRVRPTGRAGRVSCGACCGVRYHALPARFRCRAPRVVRAR